MDEDIIDVLLGRFEAATQAGYVTVGGATLNIMWLLAGMTIAIAVVWNMFGGKTPWMELFSKVLMIGFFSWLVAGWPEIIQRIQGTFVQIGLMAGDSTMTAEDFLLPSHIKLAGDEVSGLFFKAADEVTFSFSFSSGFGGSVGEWLGFYLAGWFVKLAYWLTALMIFASQIVFKVSSVLALFMTAWMVLSQTSWMGRGALGWLVSAGTMLMALAGIVSIMMTVFSGLAFDTVDEYAANQALLASFIMIALVVGAGTIARGIGSGVASWGMGAAISTAGAAAVGIGAAAAGASMIGGGAARAALGQMSSSGIGGGGFSGLSPRLSMNPSASYTGAGARAAGGRGGGTGAIGRLAASAPGGGANFASGRSAGSSMAGSAASRGLQQMQRLPAGRPGAVSSIVTARAAMPDIADDGPSMQAEGTR